MKQDFTLEVLSEITGNAFNDIIFEIWQTLQSPSINALSEQERGQLVKQMFARSMRIAGMKFNQNVDNHIYRLLVMEEEKAKKAKAKQEKSSISTTPKKAVSAQKKTLKELREERAKKNNPNQES